MGEEQGDDVARGTSRNRDATSRTHVCNQLGARNSPALLEQNCALKTVARLAVKIVARSAPRVLPC